MINKKNLKKYTQYQEETINLSRIGIIVMVATIIFIQFQINIAKKQILEMNKIESEKRIRQIYSLVVQYKKNMDFIQYIINRKKWGIDEFPYQPTGLFTFESNIINNTISETPLLEQIYDAYFYFREINDAIELAKRSGQLTIDGLTPLEHAKKNLLTRPWGENSNTSTIQMFKIVETNLEKYFEKEVKKHTARYGKFNK
jgi:hypothetical protein